MVSQKTLFGKMAISTFKLIQTTTTHGTSFPFNTSHEKAAEHQRNAYCNQ